MVHTNICDIYMYGICACVCVAHKKWNSIHIFTYASISVNISKELDWHVLKIKLKRKRNLNEYKNTANSRQLHESAVKNRIIFSVLLLLSLFFVFFFYFDLH